jgi:hypothetical protein
MVGGLPAAPPAAADTLALPDWASALPLLLPFPTLRTLVVFSAPPPDPHLATSSGEAEGASALRVCRVRMDAPPPLSSNAAAGCTQLRGTRALEQVLSASADEAASSAYLGCRSGSVLRLRLSPLRVEESLVVATPPDAALVGAAFRPEDGALWLASKAGALMQLSTRNHDAAITAANAEAEKRAAEANAEAPAWFRWRLPTLGLRVGGGARTPVEATAVPPSPSPPPPSPSPSPSPSQRRRASPLPPPPSSPPPPPPPPPMRGDDSVVMEAAETQERDRFVWAHRKLGYGPTLVLVVIGGCCGSMLGGHIYRLLRLVARPKRSPQGFASLP